MRNLVAFKENLEFNENVLWVNMQKVPDLKSLRVFKLGMLNLKNIFKKSVGK